VISARTSVVEQAVDLIRPDEHDRVECANAVHVVLTQITASDAELSQFARRRSKDARKATIRLRGAVARLQEVLADPDLPENLGGIFRMTKDETEWRLKYWRRRIDDQVRSKPKSSQPKVIKKILAASLAYRLLRNFDRPISCTKDGAFCQLAALLHGTPKANFTRPCWQVSSGKNNWDYLFRRFVVK
jgi:hypothetical protein